MDKIAYSQDEVIEFTGSYEAWLDEETGLMWEIKIEQDLEHHYVWSSEWISKATYHKEDMTDDVKDIFSYAQKLNERIHGGFDDWRVPNKSELETLEMDEPINDYYIKAPLSKNTRDYEWSATVNTNPTNEAWLADFYATDEMESPKCEAYHVRCVRGNMRQVEEDENTSDMVTQTVTAKKSASQRLREKASAGIYRRRGKK